MVIVSEDDVIKWLKSQANASSRPQFLIVLPSDIVIRNFFAAACREGLPLDQLSVMTFSDLAARIVRDTVGVRYDLMESMMLRSVVRDLIPITPSLSCFRHLPLNNRDTLQVILDEYDEYLRCSCVGQLHDDVLAAAKGLSTQYAMDRATVRLNAFRALNAEIQSHVPSSTFQTRNHLLENAISYLQSSISSLESYSYAVVAGVTVLDSLTVRMIKAIDRQLQPGGVTVFAKRGTAERTARRLESSLPPSEETGVIPSRYRPSKVTKYELPDRRREVMLVANEIRKRIDSGGKCSDVLVVASDCGTYLPLVKDIFPAYGIPFYLQTRRPYAHLYQYLMIQSVVELASLVESDSIVPWQQLTAPLRLGFSDRSHSLRWPVEDMALLYIEERVSWRESGSDDGLTYTDWKEAVAADLGWQTARSFVESLFDTIDGLLGIQDLTAEKAVAAIKSIWSSFVETMTNWVVQSADPRVDQHARFMLQWYHPTYFEGRLRRELGDLEFFLKERNSSGIEWRDVAIGFRDVILSGSYGITEADQGCVSIVDAGNTWFRKSECVYLLGMKSEEFPRKTPGGVILSDELREAISEFAEKVPDLYIRTAQNDYEAEWDKFLAVLETVNEELVMTMPYLDERGHSQEWSSFAQELDGNVTRLQPGDWLPPPSTLISTAAQLPNWIRWELYSYHSHRDPMIIEPAIDNKLLQAIASFIDPRFFAEKIEPRLTRYLDPPNSITVEASEPWFPNGLLNRLASAPFHVHELDLDAMCPFSYYFYQFLFNLYGDDFDRDRRPPTTKKLTWRYGPIPKRLEAVYLDDWTQEAIEGLLNAQYQTRSSVVKRHTSSLDFMTHVKQTALRWKGNQLAEPFRAEYGIIQRESNMKREWSWIKGGQPIVVSHAGRSVEIILPSHRLDKLDRPILLISFVNYSGHLDELLLDSKDISALSSSSLVLPEHILPVLLSYYSAQPGVSVAGAFFIELYENGRDGYFNAAWANRHREQPSRYRNLVDRTWRRAVDLFAQGVVERALSMTPSPDVTYTARPHECRFCVYRTLCLLGGI